MLRSDMDRRSIRDISSTLSNMSTERLETFIQGLREQMINLGSAQRRSETWALIVAITFLLIEIAAIGSSATIGPFEITNLADVERFLPILYSYFIYDDVVNASRFMFTRDIWDAAVKLYDRDLYDSGLDRLLVAPISSLLGPWFMPGFPTPLTPMLTVISRVMKIGAFSGILLLFGLGFWRLFSRFGISDPVVWLSLSASAAFLGFAALIYADRALYYRTVGFRAVADPRGDSPSTPTPS
jgi:hypothetical protein